MPWVHRLDMSREIDRAATGLALENIDRVAEHTCANLTASAVGDDQFTAWLEQCLLKHKPAATRLSLEIGEAAAFTHPQQFQNWCSVPMPSELWWA